MTKYTAIKHLETKKIRSGWDENQGKWFFPLVGVVDILTDGPKAGNSWIALKNSLEKAGSSRITECNPLKTQSVDGNFYKTNATETALARTGSEQPHKIDSCQPSFSSFPYSPKSVILPFDYASTFTFASSFNSTI